MCLVPALCCPGHTRPGTWLCPPGRTSGCWGRFLGGCPSWGSFSTPGFPLHAGARPQPSPARRSTPVHRLVLERGRGGGSQSSRRDEGRGRRRQTAPLPWPTAEAAVAVSGASQVVSEHRGLSVAGRAWPMLWALVPRGRRGCVMVVKCPSLGGRAAVRDLSPGLWALLSPL